MPGNMKSMMKQAEKMKVQMDKLQEEAGNKTLEITAGGGMVKVCLLYTSPSPRDS